MAALGWVIAAFLIGFVTGFVMCWKANASGESSDSHHS